MKRRQCLHALGGEARTTSKKRDRVEAIAPWIRVWYTASEELFKVDDYDSFRRRRKSKNGAFKGSTRTFHFFRHSGDTRLTLATGHISNFGAFLQRSPSYTSFLDPRVREVLGLVCEMWMLQCLCCDSLLCTL